MVKYKCLCCEYEQEFENAEAAYKAGWDVPPYFTVVQPMCNLCPSAPVVIHGGIEGARMRHKCSHERWKRDGRPAHFEEAEEDALSDGMGRKQ
jgi:hypothetical protein